MIQAVIIIGIKTFNKRWETLQQKDQAITSLSTVSISTS